MSANKPAFPRACAEVKVTDRVNQPRYNGPQDGMTMRQYYKSAVISGLLANTRCNQEWIDGGYADKTAANLADAMLAEDEEHAKK